MTASIEDVATVVRNHDNDAPVAMDIEEKLTEVTTASSQQAHELVSDALDAGIIAETNPEQGFGGIRLCEDSQDNTTVEDPETTGTNPRGEADKSLEDRSLDAFAAAIEYFHSQLDRELPETYEGSPETPREYYEDYRDWSTETIESKQLGYAPADENALLDFLMRQGFSGDAIQATGLFYEDLTPHFQGRYVLPYFDEEGNPVYAISRSLAEDSDGHPKDPRGNQKYTKAIKTKDRTFVDEPIFGADTVGDDTERLLVAGGIADAISLHEAGFSCISPVTTVRFKNKHESRVVDMVREYNIGGVYMLNDAERPTVDKTELPEGETADTIGDCLTITQSGEGLRGAFGNAEFLHDEGIDAYLCDLPGGDDYLRKLDPDDYLKENWGTVETLLRSATRAVHHDGFTEWSGSRSRAVDEAIQTGEYHESTPDQSRKQTRLYDLDFTDVSGLSIGDRQNNPFGHHGNSEGYFVCAEKNGFVHGYDHKYNIAYNALSYLLCDLGVRRADSPNGSLTDLEVFQAWKHAKENRHLPDSDPVPYRALRAIAVEDGLIQRCELVKRNSETGDIVDESEECDPDSNTDTYTALPPQTYNDVLEHIEDVHGVNPGRERAEGTSLEANGEFTSYLPAGVRNLAQEKSSGWDWKHTAEQTDATISIDDARQRTTEAIADAYKSGNRVLIEALPTMGKSYGAAKAAKKVGKEAIKTAGKSGHKITITTGRGNEEQYEQFREWCRKHDLDYYTLPSFTRDCHTANGEHGEEWQRKVMNWYRRGATPQTIHKFAEDTLGRPLPCQEHEGQSCPYASKWDFEPDNYDVLIGHYAHAHKAKVTQGRTVVFDEFPGDSFESTLGADELLPGAVSSWLQRTEEVPFDSWTDLIEHRDDEQRRADALLYFDETGTQRDELAVLEDSHAHALTPTIVFALLITDDLGNGVEHADISDDGRKAVFNRNRNELNILTPPDLDYTSGVVALDGTPTVDMWEDCLGERLNHRPVLQGDERKEYIKQALNLNLIRTSEYIKPYNSAKHVNVEADAALLNEIADMHDETPGVITTSTAEQQYLNADESLPISETKHYGNVLGSNEFKTKRVGAVIGANHYGDHYIKKWAAYAGEVAERGEGKGSDLDYGSYGNQVLQHMRGHETLQSVMRFGRDGNGAVVYVHTDTLPDWVPLAGEGRVVKTWSDGMRSVIDALECLDSPTTTEIVEYPTVNISRQQVFEHCETLRDKGVLSRHTNPDDGRGYVWIGDNLHKIGEHGNAELPSTDVDELDDDDLRQLARTTVYTSNLTNFEQTKSESETVATISTHSAQTPETRANTRPPPD
jgi:hypothetical protein